MYATASDDALPRNPYPKIRFYMAEDGRTPMFEHITASALSPFEDGDVYRREVREDDILQWPAQWHRFEQAQKERKAGGK